MERGHDVLAVDFPAADDEAGWGVGAAKLRRLVRTVLGDPGYKRSAERLAETFRREDGAARAADELEALAG